MAVLVSSATRASGVRSHMYHSRPLQAGPHRTERVCGGTPAELTTLTLYAMSARRLRFSATRPCRLEIRRGVARVQRHARVLWPLVPPCPCEHGGGAKSEGSRGALGLALDSR